MKENESPPRRRSCASAMVHPVSSTIRVIEVLLLPCSGQAEVPIIHSGSLESEAHSALLVTLFLGHLANQLHSLLPTRFLGQADVP